MSALETAENGAAGSESTAVGLSRLASISGAVLAVSYPVLAVSTGTRAAYQLLLKDGGGVSVGPLTTALAAACYLTATAGFAVRRRAAWFVSVAVLVFETAMTLAIGTASIVSPELIGSSVWRWYGIDYGFFPLFQPLLGLLWLLWPSTMSAYGVRPRRSHG